MSEEYPWLTETQFPDALDNFDRFSDPTINDLPYIQQYYSYIQQSDLNNASRILEEHPELNNKIVNASNLNKMVDGLNALEYFFTEEVEGYLADLVQYQGAYSASTQYTKYNVVLYNGMSYMYINDTASTGNTPTNTTYWIPLSVDVDKIFIATYNVTTGSQCETAYQSGKFIILKIPEDAGTIIEGYNLQGMFLPMIKHDVEDVFAFEISWDTSIVMAGVVGSHWSIEVKELATPRDIDVAIAHSTNVYWCNYGTTLFSEITTALSANKLPVVLYSPYGLFIYSNLNLSPTGNRYIFAKSSLLFGTDSKIAFDIITCDNSNTWSHGINGDEVVINNNDIYECYYNSTSITDMANAKASGKLVVCYYNGYPLECWNGSDVNAFSFIGVVYENNLPYFISVQCDTWNGWQLIAKNRLAFLDSPALTGIPTAPTASAGTNTTQIATTAFVNTAISTKQDILTFDNEPTSDSNNPVKSGGVYTALTLKAPIASPSLTGTPTAPTATAGTNTTQIATTEFVNTAIANAISNAIGGGY